MYELRENGLFITHQDAEPKFLCGPIRVLAITRDGENKRNYGLLIEWVNLDGVKLQHVFPRRQIINDYGRHLKEVLIDTGLSVSNRPKTWDQIITYLNHANPAERYISATQTGWVNKSFVTPDWCVGRETEQVIYAGDVSDMLIRSGSISDWQQSVAILCINNPMLVFAVCAGIAAPLLHWLKWPSCGIHLYGKSKIAKTTVLNLAASLYSDSSYAYSWRSTANGLEVIASSHNDMLLCLDELHQAQAEDVDQAIYMLANGMSKIRSNQDGSLGNKRSWRLLYFSTGEVGLEEKLSAIQKSVKAGQEIRFLEVPASRRFGIFDDLHGHDSIQSFSRAIWRGIDQSHGSFMPAWVQTVSEIEALGEFLESAISRYQMLWSSTNEGNQVKEAIKRFALLAVAGELAIKSGLLPWPTGEAEKSVRVAFEAWLEARGSSADSEDEKLARQLPIALKRWRLQLVQPGTTLSSNHAGYWVKDGDEVSWLLTREAFVKGLNLPYKNQLSQCVQYLKERGWLIQNEDRGTFKKQIEGGLRGGRYFKLLPNRIIQELKLDIQLSHATFPS
ncbi:hypothetical protein GCM10009092_35090 [Bowmanella denitrificans]|uniref:DUF927 domain-containing protein n=1 Tax=Bowmanella denitrificans TaxID=366582 RepID=A0ABN0XM52_9ALTE